MKVVSGWRVAYQCGDGSFGFVENGSKFVSVGVTFKTPVSGMELGMPPSDRRHLVLNLMVFCLRV